MIEDAVIYVDNKPYPTRLHEHGKEPMNQEDLYSGYMEGTKSTLTTLKNCGLNMLEFYRKDEVIVLTNIVYGEVVNMYDDHFILHLGWAGERR